MDQNKCHYPMLLWKSMIPWFPSLKNSSTLIFTRVTMFNYIQFLALYWMLLDCIEACCLQFPGKKIHVPKKSTFFLFVAIGNCSDWLCCWESSNSRDIEKVLSFNYFQMKTGNSRNLYAAGKICRVFIESLCNFKL